MFPLSLNGLTVRLLAAAVLVAATFGAGWKVGAGLTESRWARERAAEAAEYRQALERAREAERAQETKGRQASHDYQTKLAELDARYRDAIGRIGPVRVRNCPGTAGTVSGAGQASGRPNAADSGLADVPREARDAPDIGPGLVLLARDADVCRERLAGLQAWVAAVSADPSPD